MKIRKNDFVLIISGKDRGKKGKIRQVFPGEGRVMVEGVNKIKKHSRAKGTIQAGIIEREEPINIADVMYFCNKCNSPVRLGFRSIEGEKKVRVCRSCSEVVD